MPTLAQIQTENEKLKAHKEKRTYQAALVRTLETPALFQQAGPLLARVESRLSVLFDRWQEELSGAESEIDVHHRMADIAHDILRDIGQDVGQQLVPAKMGASFQAGARPRDLLTVSQWADRKRVLKTGTNAPGPWKTDRTPYLREIQDSLSEHSPARTTTFIKASGVGGTEILYNWIGYVVDHLGNKDMLLTVPTLELRNRSLNPRLRKLFRETPALKKQISDKTRDRTNRDDLLEYGASSKIIKAGANSPDSMRSDHLPYAALDEIDAYPWDLGSEGDPLSLIANRQRTFSRAKTYLVSTPTLKEESHIEASYIASDRRTYRMPCPHCGHEHAFEWSNFRYRLAPDADENDPAAVIGSAWMVCPGCKGTIAEAEKTRMLAHGRWVPEKPHIQRHRGYHINALYAPIGLGLRWAQIAAEWRAAQKDDARLKTFVNTYLGETWEEQGEQIDESSLLNRLEDYRPEDVPIALITAGIDVQKDRLEATVYGWGRGEEAWAIEQIIVPGDTATEDPYHEMDETLREYRVDFEAWDSGYNAEQVYAHVGARSYARATKGYSDDASRPFLEDEKKRRKRLRRRTRNGVQPEPLGVDNAKALLAARLKKDEPGPGYIHFTNRGGFDDEFFAQLTAEKLVVRKRRGRTKHVWVQTRTRNEALDCYILALAACRLSGRDLDQPTTGPRSKREDSLPQAPAERDPFAPIPFDET